MSSGVLSRYLDYEFLRQLSGRSLEPRGLVSGNLAGSHKSPASGFAVEFSGHREYVPGDDPKHIDWRVFFTRDKYFIKQYEMETNFVCHLMLDISKSMRYGDDGSQKMLFGSRLAVSLAHSIVRQGDKVSFTTFDTQIRGHIPASNALPQIIRMSQHLDETAAEDKTDLHACLSEFSQRMARREIVMIFSDFFGDLTKLEYAIQRIRFNKHDVVLVQVIHDHELNFNLDGMTRFIGLEVDAQQIAQPADIRKSYLQAIGRFNSELVDIATRNNCDHLLACTKDNPGAIFWEYLNQRSLQNRRI
ncbi:DUF58 domain-containing protein [Bremerella cremea]|uniref:DUF58 domain-containing protein n=1 Tax=Blastopirellula marina TaxID=124 RepID=A0A2S8FEI7_9BACT|nr:MULTISPECIES: DUF58 domain-containing protein [Pirellulaceae]PQO30500.1 DUF58 domain-containing protein [Blastopirellula marina]RCS43853.1 DUF58 domain-containing protein [Bremerella cremea]